MYVDVSGLPTWHTGERRATLSCCTSVLRCHIVVKAGPGPGCSYRQVVYSCSTGSGRSDRDATLMIISPAS
jgi:hypothetical protein